MKPLQSCLCLLVLSSLAAGCSEEPPPGPLEPGTFSATNVEFLTYDCRQTIVCNNARGKPRMTVEECVYETATTLEQQRDTSGKQAYLDNVMSCNALSGCAYVACADWLELMSYDCRQETACYMPGTDPNAGLTECVQMKIVEASGFNSADEQNYPTAFNNCSHLAGCDFENCFVF